MGRAGFVLVGGNSSRMGTNKAFLKIGDRSLLDCAARVVRQAAGSVALVGDPATYRYLGYAIVPDTMPGAGPLAGIHAALQFANIQRAADWNLITACDMPALSSQVLESMLDLAEMEQGNLWDCVVPEGPTGRPEPLCAVYHRRCADHVGRALANGVRKVTDGLSGLRILRRRFADDRAFQNLNTPLELDRFVNG